MFQYRSIACAYSPARGVDGRQCGCKARPSCRLSNQISLRAARLWHRHSPPWSPQSYARRVQNQHVRNEKVAVHYPESQIRGRRSRDRSSPWRSEVLKNPKRHGANSSIATWIETDRPAAVLAPSSRVRTSSPGLLSESGYFPVACHGRL
jgi:hypothetical protein